MCAYVYSVIFHYIGSFPFFSLHNIICFPCVCVLVVFFFMMFKFVSLLSLITLLPNVTNIYYTLKFALSNGSSYFTCIFPSNTLVLHRSAPLFNAV